MDHIREGKHGARSTKQAIAIGLSKARRAGVKLKPPKGGSTSEKTRKQAKRDLKKGSSARSTSAKRSRATTKALKREGRAAASTKALSRHSRAAAGGAVSLRGQPRRRRQPVRGQKGVRPRVMEKKHPAESKSVAGNAGGGAGAVGEKDRKKMELGDAMEHEHGAKREELEEEIERMDEKKSE